MSSFFFAQRKSNKTRVSNALPAPSHHHRPLPASQTRTRSETKRRRRDLFHSLPPSLFYLLIYFPLIIFSPPEIIIYFASSPLPPLSAFVARPSSQRGRRDDRRPAATPTPAPRPPPAPRQPPEPDGSRRRRPPLGRHSTAATRVPEVRVSVFFFVGKGWGAVPVCSRNSD